MAREKAMSTIDDLKSIDPYFQPEVAARMRAVGIRQINQVDMLMAVLFSVDSLSELTLDEADRELLKRAKVKTAGELFARMTRKMRHRRNWPKLLRG